MHVRCTHVGIASILPFPRHLVRGVSHLLPAWQLRTGSKAHPTPPEPHENKLGRCNDPNGDWASWCVSCIRHGVFIIREPNVHIWRNADNEACNLVAKLHKPRDEYLCADLPVAQGGGMQDCHCGVRRRPQREPGVMLNSVEELSQGDLPASSDDGSLPM